MQSPTILRQNWFVTPVNTVSHSTVDPFNTTLVPITEEVDTLMKYFAAAQSAGGNAYKLHLLPEYVQDAVMVDRVVQSFWNNFLRYEHAMYAMMAFMAVRLLVITKVRLSNIKSPDHYMQKAITSLRRRLQECQNPALEADHATMGAMTQIALADWTSGNLGAARIHLSVLSNLVQHVDVEEMTGRLMVESIRTVDLQVALETRQMPFLPAAPSFEPLSRGRINQVKRLLDHVARNNRTMNESSPDDMATRLGQDPKPPHDILEDCSITLDFRLGNKLEEALESDILYPSIRPVLRNVLDCLTLAKFLWRTSEATSKDVRWMCRTARTMVHHLWTYGWDHANDPHDTQHRLTDCVRLALVILLTLATNRLASRAVGGLGQELYMAYQRLEMPCNASKLQRRLYLWTLITGVFVARESSHEKSWLLYEAAAAARGLGLTSYEALHDAMTDFIYSWTMQMESLQQVASMIEVDEAMASVELRG